MSKVENTRRAGNFGELQHGGHREAIEQGGIRKSDNIIFGHGYSPEEIARMGVLTVFDRPCPALLRIVPSRVAIGREQGQLGAHSPTAFRIFAPHSSQ